MICHRRHGKTRTCAANGSSPFPISHHLGAQAKLASSTGLLRLLIKRGRPPSKRPLVASGCAGAQRWIGIAEQLRPVSPRRLLTPISATKPRRRGQTTLDVRRAESHCLEEPPSRRPLPDGSPCTPAPRLPLPNGGRRRCRASSSLS